MFLSNMNGNSAVVDKASKIIEVVEAFKSRKDPPDGPDGESMQMNIHYPLLHTSHPRASNAMSNLSSARTPSPSLHSVHPHYISLPSSANSDLLIPSTAPSTAPHGTRTVEGVLGESSRKSLLAADFLATNEAVHGDCNGAVDVCSVAVLAEAHLGERFADSKNRFEVTDLRIGISKVFHGVPKGLNLL